MYNITSYRSDTNFSGYRLPQPRYNADGTDNKLFRIGKELFCFNITGQQIIEKREPIGGLVYMVRQITIETREPITSLPQGSYVEFDGELWIVRNVAADLGPQKKVYAKINVNTMAKTTAVLEQINL